MSVGHGPRPTAARCHLRAERERLRSASAPAAAASTHERYARASWVRVSRRIVRISLREASRASVHELKVRISVALSMRKPNACVTTTSRHVRCTCDLGGMLTRRRM